MRPKCVAFASHKLNGWMQCRVHQVETMQLDSYNFGTELISVI